MVNQSLQSNPKSYLKLQGEAHIPLDSPPPMFGAHTFLTLLPSPPFPPLPLQRNIFYRVKSFYIWDPSRAPGKDLYSTWSSLWVGWGASGLRASGSSLLRAKLMLQRPSLQARICNRGVSGTLEDKAQDACLSALGWARFGA